MKIRLLFIALIAILTMNANAESFTCDSRVDLPEGYIIHAGQTDASYHDLVFTRLDDGDNFTNLQINMYLPEGLSVASCVASNATKFYDEDAEEERQALNLVTSMHPDGYYVIGLVNATYRGDQIKITTNPISVARMKFTADDNFLGGEIKASVKYTDYANNDYTNEECIVATFVNPSAVANLTAGKTVAGVRYYNIAGQAANKAYDGVNVVVTTYSDGTQSVDKVVK